MHAHAGVVHQQVHLKAELRHARGQLRRGLGAHEVRRQHLHAPAVRLAQLAGELMQAVRPARHEDQIVLVLRARAREGGADAAGGAGDEGGLGHGGTSGGAAARGAGSNRARY